MESADSLLRKTRLWRRVLIGIYFAVSVLMATWVLVSLLAIHCELGF